MRDCQSLPGPQGTDGWRVSLLQSIPLCSSSKARDSAESPSEVLQLAKQLLFLFPAPLPPYSPAKRLCAGDISQPHRNIAVLLLLSIGKRC